MRAPTAPAGTRDRRARRGSSAVEFALWLPILAVLVSGVVDFGWYMSRSYSIARVVRDSARTAAAVLEPTDATPGALAVPAALAHAREVFDGLGIECSAGCDIDATVEDAPGFRIITVSVHWPYQPLIGLVPISTTIHHRFSMAMEAQ